LTRSAKFVRRVLLAVVLTLLVCAPAFAQFETRGGFATQKFPESVAVGDFNHDGKLDLAVASLNKNTGFSTDVQILLGNGDGTFQRAVDYPVGTSPDSVATADFNGDGNLDLVVLNGQSDNFSVLLGRGDGTFLPAVNYATPPGPIFVTTGDFNGDGKLDIATISLGDSTGRCECVAIFLGNGDGTFQTVPIITTPTVEPFAIGVGYFSSDGHLDLAVAEYFGSTDQVEILLGNGDGTFHAGDVYPVCCEPSSIAVADFNGDHKSAWRWQRTRGSVLACSSGTVTAPSAWSRTCLRTPPSG
jgi:FG-GAP-like repeat/FG-GAP repeat